MLRTLTLSITALLFNTHALLAAEDAASGRVVSVTGTAVMRTVPDVITWHITTQDEDRDLLQAKEQSDIKMKQILGLKDELDVDAKDLQTGQLSIRKEYNRDRSGNRTEFKHFAVSRNVTIKQRDLTRFDEYVSKLLTAAEMDVRFSFESTRFHELRSETRLKALLIAKEKAEAMTKALGAKCGRVLTIEEHRPKNFYSSPISNSAYFDAGAPLPVDASTGTFAPGAIEIRVSVDVTFEIE